MSPSFRTLRYIMEVTEEAGAVPPPSRDGEKELQVSYGKEVELADSLIDLQHKEERTTPIEERLLETLKKESDEASEKSSDFSALLELKSAWNSLPSAEKKNFKEDQVSECFEESLDSREGDNPNISKKNCQDSNRKEESYKSQEEIEPTEKLEKPKKMMRVQS
ncbi:hypothetical protein V6N13_071210 [Hibiscus sabdariffa]|uniref:Uncharacterized protein n=1 Tax=Hibiscus sabdariffa TaxID=183260 RepID=A0ABR2TEB4_9ROSI